MRADGVENFAGVGIEKDRAWNTRAFEKHGGSLLCQSALASGTGREGPLTTPDWLPNLVTHSLGLGAGGWIKRPQRVANVAPCTSVIAT